MMALTSSPEFLVCLNCESPCYVFEWEKGEATETLCLVCGSEENDQFLTEEAFDALGEGEDADSDD